MNIPYVNGSQFPNLSRECHILVVRDPENPMRVVPCDEWSCPNSELVIWYDIPSQLTAKAVNTILDRIAPEMEHIFNDEPSSTGFASATMAVGRIISDFVMDEIDWNDPDMWVEWRDQ